MRRLDAQWLESSDPVIRALRERVQRPGNFHEPKPGDADYIEPEVRAWLKWGCQGPYPGPERRKAKRM